VRDPLRAAEFRDRRRVRRVERRRREPAGAFVVALDDTLTAILMMVREHDALVEVTSGSDRRERRADTARPDDEDPH